MGWGGIIINVVVALKCVTRCGCFEVTCHARALCGCGVGWVGWGGIIINVVVALKCVTRCGCFEVTCHERAVWVWGGVGGVGRDNYKRCSCIEVCDTLWLF